MKTSLHSTLLLGLMILASTAAAQPAFIKQVPRASGNFITAGDNVYFTANDSLFSSDGTADGTHLIKSGLRFEYAPRLFAFNDLLIFIVFVQDGPYALRGREMWRTDGTSSGTFQLITSNEYDLNILGIVNTTLYFSAGHPTAGSEIFKTDGTTAGTTLLKDINPGDANSFPSGLAALGNDFYFVADDGVNGRELWKTDGSAAGTTMVRDVNPGPDNGIGGTTPAAFNNRLYFSGITPGAGAEPWVTDGTADGTFLLKDLIPGDSSFDAIEYGIDMNGSLYFFASNTISDEPEFSEATTSLWRTDGSTTSTTHIKDFSTRCAYCGTEDYWIYNNQLFFFLQETPDRDVLYSTDGTTEGTQPVFSLASNGRFIGELNGQLIFSDVGNYMHIALYRTDGTLAGTEAIRVLISDRNLSRTDVVLIGEQIFFPDHDAPRDLTGSGYRAEDQYQLMVSDGSAARSIRSLGGGSYHGSQNLVDLDGHLIFTTEDVYPFQTGDYKKKLWILDPSKPFESKGTFTLVNADTDEDIQTLTGGEVIPKSVDTNFNIRFDPPGAAGSVVFRYQGKKVRTENAPPFALAGDKSGDYMPWTSGIPGSHTVEATPFSEAGGKGTAGTPFAITFTIVEGSPVACHASGVISWDYWAKVSGAKVSDIPLSAEPTSTSELNTFESPQNIGPNYASRIRGYLCPPQTGDYVFWIASNDHSELWVSTDDDPAHRQRVAYVTGATDYRQWTKFRSQRSEPIRLIAGAKYYVEALHKQGVGTDHLSVGWTLPDGTMERPIDGNRLSPFAAQGDILSQLIVPAAGSTGIDPSVLKLEAEWVDGASRYTVEVSDQADFSGESIVLASADEQQNKFIVKDLANSTTYYARVKTDISGFGPVTMFTTRDPISRMRLWGIATYGGENNVGTLFSYSVDDNTFIKHYDQPVEWDGYYNEERIMGTLVPGPDGVFYGHREENYGSQMFEMDAQGNVTWWGGSAYFYESQLMLASNNQIYSTTADNWVPGIVDRYDVDAQTLILDYRMHFFTQFSDPHRPLIEHSDGYLYGVGGEGGVNEGGFIYKFRLDGSGFKIIHYFDDSDSGMRPYAGLVELNGFLYGTTTEAGEFGYGTIFRIKPDGTAFSKLHDFNGEGGSAPRAELIVLNDVLFGTTDAGGASGQGTVFRIDPDGTGYSVLHSFNGVDGSDPSRGLAHDRNGNLYGMTSYGGAHNMGVIYKVSTTGTGFTKLFDFSSETGGNPNGALVIREDTYQPGGTVQSSMANARQVEVSIHPNPSTDYFRMDVSSSGSEKIQFVVMDLSGEVVTSREITNGTPIEFGAELKRGLYIIKVIQGKDVTMHRLVKK